MKRYRQAVAALVLRPLSTHVPKGSSELYEFLIVHKPRKNDAWQLPQGGIEAGETYEHAARRELMEETCLAVGEVLHVSEIVYTYDFPPAFVARHKPINSGQTLYFVSFRAPPDANVCVDKHEIDTHRWIRLDQLRSYIERPEYVAIIETVYAEALARPDPSAP